jgi:rhodanese-related sulfurtransferase
MNKIKILITAAFLFLSSFGCAKQDQSNSITMEQFKEILKNGKDIIVLDVRTPEETATGMIENAINIPVQVLEQRVDELEKFKEKEIFVICRTQNRAPIGASILTANGYKAKYVIGGMSVYNQK